MIDKTFILQIPDLMAIFFSRKEDVRLFTVTEGKSLALIASSDDNFMRDISNINNLLSHRGTEPKFFEFSVLRQLSGLCSGS